MNVHGRRFTDDTVTRMLDHWLADGPITMPDELFADAVRQAGMTRQRRWRGRILRMTGSSGVPAQVGLTVAAIATVVVAAIGISLGTNPPPAVVPTPSIVPTADPTPVSETGGEFRTFAEAGFSIEVQPDWITNEVAPEGIAVTSGSRAQIFIAVGGPDGTLETCRISWFECLDLQVDSLSDLERAIYATGSDLPSLGSQPASVDGEEALILTSRQAWPTVRHWLFMHGGRPYLIQYQEFVYRPDSVPPMAAALLDSWEWVSEPAPETPTVVSDPERGYEFTLPAGLHEGGGRDGERVFLDRNTVALVITVGEPDGSIRICQSGYPPASGCVAIVADSLDDLRAAVVAVNPPDGFGWETGHNTFEIDGELAESERMTGNGSGPTSTKHWFYTIHAGRPFAIWVDGRAPLVDMFDLLNSWHWLESD
jgi:hypothetical protein